MFQSNSTFGIYSTSLQVLFRHKKYLFFILFLVFYPVFLIINRIFLKDKDGIIKSQVLEVEN